MIEARFLTCIYDYSNWFLGISFSSTSLVFKNLYPKCVSSCERFCCRLMAELLMTCSMYYGLNATCIRLAFKTIIVLTTHHHNISAMEKVQKTYRCELYCRRKGQKGRAYYQQNDWGRKYFPKERKQGKIK